MSNDFSKKANALIKRGTNEQWTAEHRMAEIEHLGRLYTDDERDPATLDRLSDFALAEELVENDGYIFVDKQARQPRKDWPKKIDWANESEEHRRVSLAKYRTAKKDRWTTVIPMSYFPTDELETGEMAVGMRMVHPDDAIATFMDKPYMERFTTRERQVMILWHVSLLSHADIATYLGITENTSKVTLSNAHKECTDFQRFTRRQVRDITKGTFNEWSDSTESESEEDA